MKRKKIAWITALALGISALVFSLVSGCAKGPSEMAPEKEKPEYGGMLTLGWWINPPLDDFMNWHFMCATLHLTNEEPFEGDWTKGEAAGYGTKEVDWRVRGMIASFGSRAGAVIEKQEIGEDTITWHVRKGIHWHNKPPTNGRELTADDVAWSLNRQLTSPIGKAYLPGPVEVSVVDPYTLVMKLPREQRWQFDNWFGDYFSVWPKDAGEEFGGFTDWKNSIGSGPFMLTEYVADSHMLLTRNPNYWQKNPIGPGKGDQLPYLDKVKILVIPEQSTAESLFRTGQLDILDTPIDTAAEFLRMPQVKHTEIWDDWGRRVIYMRLDKKDKPWSDERVRKALMMAIDYKQIVDQLYGGKAVVLSWPLMPIPPYTAAYMPLEEMPAEVRELYTYNPQKAKQLLAEAGYPNGFKVKMFAWSNPGYLDPVLLIKDMWAKVGVEMELETVDYGTYTNVLVNRSYEEMAHGEDAGAATYCKGMNWYGPQRYNGSYIDDPVLTRAVEAMMEAWPNETECMKIHKQTMPYLLARAYTIPLPKPVTYRFWWPWVKNYSGESGVGYYNQPNFAKYVWIDQELKKSMGY